MDTILTENYNLIIQSRKNKLTPGMYKHAFEEIRASLLNTGNIGVPRNRESTRLYLITDRKLIIGLHNDDFETLEDKVFESLPDTLKINNIVYYKVFRNRLQDPPFTFIYNSSFLSQFSYMFN